MPFPSRGNVTGADRSFVCQFEILKAPAGAYSEDYLSTGLGGKKAGNAGFCSGIVWRPKHAVRSTLVDLTVEHQFLFFLGRFTKVNLPQIGDITDGENSNWVG